MKYDFDLSLEEHTSLGKILAQIEDNSTVLEFGPGNGRMTEYLVKEKNCQVAIVEFDEELYQTVMQYAADGFLGNIDSFEWVSYFDQQQFDYLIFADVLEHLTNTEEVLKISRRFLKDSGRLLLTFPNLAHNSVLIGLFNNELVWNEYGLLDHTHNTFFTQHGFEAVFERAGLFIALEDYTYSQVGQNEINTSYDQLPLPARYDFKARLFGEVYQYFYALAKEPVSEPLRQIPANSNFVKEMVLTYQYTDRKESGMFLFNNLTGENKETRHQLAEDVESLTIYPLKGSGIVYFKALLNSQVLQPTQSNYIALENHLYLFSGKEERPYFKFNCPELAGAELQLQIDVISENQFYEIEETAFSQFPKAVKALASSKTANQQLTLEKELLQERAGALAAKLQQQPLMKWALAKETLFEYTKYSSELAKQLQVNIEQIDVIPEEKKTVIHGWGYSPVDQQPLTYTSPITQGSQSKTTATLRQDVIDMFELSEGQKYGFIIEIDDFLANKRIRLDISDGQKQKWQLKFDRFNLSNASAPARLRRLLGSIRQNGLHTSWRNWQARKHNQNAYDVWIAQYENFDWEQLAAEAQHWAYQPKISIVVPVYNVEEKWLLACVDSLKKQVYPNWELCLADDASTEEHIRPMLEQLQTQDARIKVIFRQQNGHISEATNSAIGLATGEYIGFMDNDDELAPNALFEVVKALNEDQQIDFIYTDEDKITVRGQRFDPFFKPDWNEELLLGHNYITHFVVVKKEIVTTKAGGLRHEYNGSQDYDFVLRATEVAGKIHHIPKILYHWRTLETSTALDPQSKEYAYTAGKLAVQAALDRRQIPATVEMTKNYGAYKVNYLLEKQPLVSIICLGAETNIGGWLEKLLADTDYLNFEVLLPERFQTAVGSMDQRVRYETGDNVNALAQKALGDHLVFLNENLIPKNSQWLDELVHCSQRPAIGLTTGKIITADEVVLNVGVSLNREKQQAEFDQRGASNKTIGYYFRPVLPRELFAATADLLLIKKALFEEVGGFDLSLPQALQGIDLSLRVRRQSQQKIVFQPDSQMIITDQSAFDEPLALADLLKQYPEGPALDPYTNENLFRL